MSDTTTAANEQEGAVTTLEALGSRLRRWRLSQSPTVSQVTLAKQLEISQPLLSLIERGRTPNGTVSSKINALLDSLTNESAETQGS